jgi:hypothetical protein
MIKYTKRVKRRKEEKKMRQEKILVNTRGFKRGMELERKKGNGSVSISTNQKRR